MKNMDYYKSKGIEAIDVIDAFDLNFNLGNVVKYVLRAGRKTENALDDLNKAIDYLDREIIKLANRKAKTNKMVTTNDAVGFNKDVGIDAKRNESNNSR